MTWPARLIIAVVVVLVLSVWLAPKAARWLAIDRCLDSGGRWDDARIRCER
jgi:hypothetical protein